MNRVIGSGDLADRFCDYSIQEKYALYFGSINDPASVNVKAMKEDELNLKNQLLSNQETTFIYFSTCSIQDPMMRDQPFINHKINSEKLIQASGRNFIIFRLPELISMGKDCSGLLKFLIESIKSESEFELCINDSKNIIDIDDVYEVVNYILKNKIYLNEVVNIASDIQTKLVDLVNEIEEFFDVKAKYKVIDNHISSYQIENNNIKSILRILNINFDEKYIKNSLKKYYESHINGRKLLSLIVPTYNEENGIAEFYSRVKAVLLKLAPRFNYEIIFINDFSTDNTLDKLNLIASMDKNVKIINFSRNFGNQIAIAAGIDFVKGDISVIIDDDLQDPPEIIPNLLAKWDKGYKVVYGVRPRRRGVNPLFKFIANIYYRVINLLSDINIPKDAGDFRLIDRVIVEHLKGMKEENRYYRGMVAWVGFPQIGVEYVRDRRFAGTSTFSFKKYLGFALGGITSFTEKPLYISTLFGIFITSVSFLLGVVLVVTRIVDPSVSIRGWTSLVLVILFFGGVQLLSIGLLGAYISKIYREVKGRPLYIVENSVNF